jgi:hypothetical protein
MASKKQGTSASAGSPIDFVSAAGFVRVPQDLISWLNFSLIDFGGRLRSSPGCRSQLIKPTELWLVIIFVLFEYEFVLLKSRLMSKDSLVKRNLLK